ncbi:MAG: hypothetical protein ABSE73_15320 [Planctomycetota bacterium]
MAVYVVSQNPSGLLQAIKEAVQERAIDTWSVDSDGDFTHSAEQWKNKAWFRPAITEDRLILNILAPKETHLSRAVYGVYHGRFVEMLLNHFDNRFSQARATALPTKGDRVDTRR